MYETATYSNGMKEGLGKTLYQNGAMREYMWENGMLNGYGCLTRAPFLNVPEYKDHFEFDKNKLKGFMLRETTDNIGKLQIKY